MTHNQLRIRTSTNRPTCICPPCQAPHLHSTIPDKGLRPCGCVIRCRCFSDWEPRGGALVEEIYDAEQPRWWNVTFDAG